MGNNEMTVGELIEMLQELPEDALVRFASQPAWPFEYEIKDRAVEGKTEDGEAVVYLVEGEQMGYLPAEVAGEAWNR